MTASLPNIPTPWVVGLHVYAPGPANLRNVATKTYDPPKANTGKLIRVQGWAPPGGGGGTEPKIDRQVQRLELLCPPVIRVYEFVDGKLVPTGLIDAISPMDIIDLPTHRRPIRTEADLAATEWDRFEVQGFTRDYTVGPFLWAPGKVVDLERTT